MFFGDNKLQQIIRINEAVLVKRDYILSGRELSAVKFFNFEEEQAVLNVTRPP